LQTAIEMFTIKGAFAMRQEDRVGSLTVGKEADLVVLDLDILACHPNDIGQANVLQTIVGGREVYKSPLF